LSFDSSILRPGHILLYKPSSFFGRVIARFSKYPISHVEMYKGGGISYASRDGLGVAQYELREEDLAYVLESTFPLDMARVAKAFAGKDGDPYDWGTIVKHISERISEGAPHSEVCSELVTYLARVGGAFSLFGVDPPDRVKPADFLDEVSSGLLRVIWES
jgi:hypothetical protein